MKLCTVCGVVTSRAGSRCTEHARQSNRSRHNALYSTPAWQRLSARVLRVWRGERGNWCPGYQRHAHRAADLTVDHVVPLAAGGAPFDIGNTAVLCRSCNSTKGASTDRGGVALMAAPMRPDRVPKEREELMHAIYERITVAGPEIVGVRLTQAAYAHGLALALPEKVEMARPTVSESTT